MLRFAALVLVFAATLGFSSSADATVITFKAFLDGPSENPPVASPGTGEATVIYDDVAHTLQVDLEWEGLVGTTTVAHIHCCVDPPGTVGVATFPGTFPGFPVGVMAGTYTGSWSLTDTASYTATFLTDFGGGTAAGAEAALVAGMLDGRAYVNIHSSFAGGGEIRGFLREVPEPGTLVLLALGMMGVVARRRIR
jgi:hypothetical protein